MTNHTDDNSGTRTGSSSSSNGDMIVILLQSLLSNSIQNWSRNNHHQQPQQRSYDPSLSERWEDEEQWTKNNNSSESEATRTEKDSTNATVNDCCWFLEEGSLSGIVTAPSFPCTEQQQNQQQQLLLPTLKELELVLVQYRPAWMEQLALRIAGIDHTVVNSQYAVTECCGVLPLLQDFSNKTKQALPPAIVGRYQFLSNYNKSHTNNKSSAILDYLFQHYPNEFSKKIEMFPIAESSAFLSSGKTIIETNGSSIVEHKKRTTMKSNLFQMLIEDRLNPCWTHLRYTKCGDKSNNTWTSIYRKQSLSASSNSSFSLFAMWQAWSEWIHYTVSNHWFVAKHFTVSSSLSEHQNAMEQIRWGYNMIEQQLQEIKNLHINSSQHDDHSDQCYYLLGTNQPAVVDLLLFDHLMNALTDIHLVMLLADYPIIAEYVQRIWDQFFDLTSKPSSTSTSVGDSKWKQWNNYQNITNPFNTIPIAKQSNISNGTLCKTKTWIGGNSSSSSNNQLPILNGQYRLYEILVDVKAVRENQLHESSLLVQRPIHGTGANTWYRWRMGDTCYPSSSSTQPSKHNRSSTDGTKNSSSTDISKQQKQLNKERKRNDEIWLTAVFLTTATISVLYGYQKQQQRSK